MFYMYKNRSSRVNSSQDVVNRHHQQKHRPPDPPKKNPKQNKSKFQLRPVSSETYVPFKLFEWYTTLWKGRWQQQNYVPRQRYFRWFLLTSQRALRTESVRVLLFPVLPSSAGSRGKRQPGDQISWLTQENPGLCLLFEHIFTLKDIPVWMIQCMVSFPRVSSPIQSVRKCLS